MFQNQNLLDSIKHTVSITIGLLLKFPIKSSPFALFKILSSILSYNMWCVISILKSKEKRSTFTKGKRKSDSCHKEKKNSREEVEKSDG